MGLKLLVVIFYYVKFEEKDNIVEKRVRDEES